MTVPEFYDSKRPYQTDGLDAYVVKCYDDNLHLHSTVMNIKTGKEMTLSYFIRFISTMNLSDDEIREAIENSK